MFIASIQKDELICSFTSSANYHIQQQNLNNMHMMKHKNLWISCCCHSLNCIYSKLCKFMLKAHMLWKVSIKSILVTNIEWENLKAHATFSYID